MSGYDFNQYAQLRATLIADSNFLSRFRSTFLAYERAVWPDVPHPQYGWLQWNGHLGKLQRLRANLAMMSLIVRAKRAEPMLAWQDCVEPGIGKPRLSGWGVWHTTEAQVRAAYYRKRIERFIESLDDMRVVDIGGGYGHLAGELLRFHRVQRVTVVERPEIAPLTRWYLGHWKQERTRVESPQAIESIPTADLAISTTALQHLGPDEVRHYLAYVSQAQWAYLVHRDQPRTQGEVRMADFEQIDGMQLVHKAPVPFFKGHFERVYRRIKRI